MQALIATHQHVTNLTAIVASLTKAKESAEARSLHWMEKVKEGQAEVQCLKGEFDQAARDAEKKDGEYLDKMGLQSWLARVEAIE